MTAIRARGRHRPGDGRARRTGRRQRRRAARGDPRALHRRRPGRPCLDQGPLRGGRPGRPRGPDRQHRSRAGKGRQPDLPAVGTGSHIDAIPHSGRFDGTVGVLGGLEAIRALQARRVPAERSIELLMFTSEEPTRFGIGCLGSRALCGASDGRDDGRAAGRGGPRVSTRSAAPRGSAASSGGCPAPRGVLTRRSSSCTSSRGRSSSARGSRSASSRRSRPRRRCG